MAPKVSIVIPTYNRHALVSASIDSCLEQTVADLEVLVVDDASTDGTVDVLRDAYGENERVRLLPLKTNVGIASARNHGVEHARGEVITLLDSDDVYLPRFLEAHLATLDAHPDVALTASDSYYDGTWPAGWTTVFARQRPPTSGADMCAGAWMLPSSVAMRASVLKTLRFKDGCRLLEDNELWFRFFEAGYRVHVVEEPLLYYRRFGAEDEEEGLSANKLRVREAALALEERYAHLAANPRTHRRRMAMRRAKCLREAGKAKAALPHARTWWRMQPWSPKALGMLARLHWSARRRP